MVSRSIKFSSKEASQIVSVRLGYDLNRRTETGDSAVKGVNIYSLGRVK